MDAGLLNGVVNGIAPVTVPADPSADPVGFLNSILRAAEGGQWLLVALIVLVGLVWATRRYGGELWPFLATKRGGAILAFVYSALFAVVAKMASGAAFNWRMIVAVMVVTFGAVGGRRWIKDLWLNA